MFCKAAVWQAIRRSKLCCENGSPASKASKPGAAVSQLAGANAKCVEGNMTSEFDVIAIGTGSAASAVVSRCREAGWQVAIVDSRPFGGTCALRGCDPKKVLVGAAEAVDWARRMKGKGIQAAKIQIDWAELMRFKRSFTEPVPKRGEDGFAKAGIAAFHGRARFAGPTTVQAGEETLAGRDRVISDGRGPANFGGSRGGTPTPG